jgi:hypothetical protein
VQAQQNALSRRFAGTNAPNDLFGVRFEMLSFNALFPCSLSALSFNARFQRSLSTLFFNARF